MSFLMGNNILNPKQTGFIPKLGCEVNLARLRQRVDDVLAEGNGQKFLLFIDLKNAYDSVNHQILFNRLRAIGIVEEIINTISKFYSNAKMRLSIEQQPLNVNRGVLQGSILSPMLFNIYINERIMTIVAYADDIAVICRSREELTKVMVTIERWQIIMTLR